MTGNDPAIELLVCLKTLRWFAFSGHMESPTNLLMITYSLVLKEASEISCYNQNFMRSKKTVSTTITLADIST